MKTQSTTRLDEYGRKRFAQVILFMLVYVALFFVCAGGLSFLWGWVYLGVSIVSLFFGGLYVFKYNPDAINERGRPAEKQKSWDKVVIAVYAPLSLSVYVVSGLDTRFSWSDMPLWLHLVGVFLTLIMAALTYAAMAHNKFLSMVVQVVEERGHQVASSGPYRFVRHPMYLSLVVSWPSLAILFGSYWALIPGALASVAILVRTALEDQTLQEELPGYVDYARQVRYRLLPGVW